MKNIIKINLLLFLAMITSGLKAQTSEERVLKLKEKDLLIKANLDSLIKNMSTTKSKSFAWLTKNKEKVNTVLGKDKAEYAIRSAIAKDYMPKVSTYKTSKPDWGQLEVQMKELFGSLGEEVVNGSRMIYSLENKDWLVFGEYYQLYFQKAYKRPEYIINDITWSLFLNVTDTNVLRFACDTVMAYAMEEWYQNYCPAWDTYANLLYKLGRKQKALEVQEKAVKLAKGTSFEQELTDNLEKMKKNQITWNAVRVAQ